MAGKKQLPPVGLDDASQDGSLTAAIDAGDRLAELEAMRRIIARHVESPNTLARDLAALTRRQMELSEQIESLRTLKSEEEGAEREEAPADGDTEPFDPAAI